METQILAIFFDQSVKVEGCGLVLYMGSSDGDPALLFLSRTVNGIKRANRSKALVTQHLRDRSSQSGFTMVHMTDCTDVHVELVALEFFFCHN